MRVAEQGLKHGLYYLSITHSSAPFPTLASPLPIQLPANALQEALRDSLNDWAPATLVGDPDWTMDSQDQPGPAPVILSIWGRNQQTKDVCVFLLCSCSALQRKENNWAKRKKAMQQVSKPLPLKRDPEQHPQAENNIQSDWPGQHYRHHFLVSAYSPLCCELVFFYFFPLSSIKWNLALQMSLQWKTSNCSLPLCVYLSNKNK